MMEEKYNIPKSRLYELYLKKHKSIKDIAMIIGCSERTIHRRLKKFKQEEIKKFVKTIKPCIKKQPKRRYN